MQTDLSDEALLKLLAAAKLHGAGSLRCRTRSVNHGTRTRSGSSQKRNSCMGGHRSCDAQRNNRFCSGIYERTTSLSSSIKSTSLRIPDCNLAHLLLFLGCTRAESRLNDTESVRVFADSRINPGCKDSHDAHRLESEGNLWMSP